MFNKNSKANTQKKKTASPTDFLNERSLHIKELKIPKKKKL